jgi:hypothetical protein
MRSRDGQRPTQAVLESLETLVGHLSSKYSIGQEQIFSHGDLVNTQCPGPLLREEMNRIARAAAAPRGRGAAAE